MDRAASKATRLMVLFTLESSGKLQNLSDAQIAERLGVTRQTIWRDRRELIAMAASIQKVANQILD